MSGKLRNMTGIFITYENSICLLYRQDGSVVNDVWIPSAGGHFEEYEQNDARACVLRELEEETGIREDAFQSIHLRYVTLRRSSGEIRQIYYFFAELKAYQEFFSNEGSLRWFHLSEVRNLKMPFTAEFVMDHYLRIGKFNHSMYGGIANGETVIFTEMPEF